MGLLADKLSKKNISDYELELILGHIVDKICSVSFPKIIYIFGSYAKGNFTEASDIDVAIIFDTIEELKAQKKLILNNKLFLNESIDLLFYTMDDFEKKAVIGGVCSQIKNKGRIIYDKRSKI